MLDFNSEFGRIVKKHLEDEYFVWMTTVDSKGMPQPRPVWFIWEDDSFLVFSQAHAYKLKHLKINSKVSMHFNTVDEKGEVHVIVFTAEAIVDTSAPPAHENHAYFKKYETGFIDLKMSPEDFSNEYSVAIRIQPSNVRGWK